MAQTLMHGIKSCSAGFFELYTLKDSPGYNMLNCSSFAQADQRFDDFDDAIAAHQTAADALENPIDFGPELTHVMHGALRAMWFRLKIVYGLVTGQIPPQAVIRIDDEVFQTDPAHPACTLVELLAYSMNDLMDGLEHMLPFCRPLPDGHSRSHVDEDLVDYLDMDEPFVMLGLFSLACHWKREGRHAEALVLMRKCVWIGEQFPDTGEEIMQRLYKWTKEWSKDT